MPINYIETLDEAEILAFSIAFGEFEGGEWNWDREKWNEPK